MSITLGKTLDAQRAVAVAAYAWWRAHRPGGWSEAKHLTNPAINVATERERDLALAVAALRVETRRPLRGRR